MAHNCTRCGRQIESWDSNYFGRGMLCPICYSEGRRREAEKSSICTRCGLRIRPRDANMQLGRTLCRQCYEDLVKEKRENFCASCGRRFAGASFQRPDGSRLCIDCMRAQSPGGGGRAGLRRCYRCGRKSVIHHITSEGESLCPQCSVGHTDKGLLKKMIDAIRGGRG